MKFYVSAAHNSGRDWIAREIEAADFEDAWAILSQLAVEKWGREGWRLTSVTEQPDIAIDGPIQRAIALTLPRS